MPRSTLADDLAYMTIRELGGHIRRGAVSVEQLVRAALERADRIDHRLNSFITVAADSALMAAKALDGELRRGTSRGALHGIPVTIKDHVDTAGIRTTAGSTILKDRVPAVDAPVVRQLKAAGAVVIGKANLNQFAGGESGWNPDYGKIRNPRALMILGRWLERWIRRAGCRGHCPAVDRVGQWRARFGYRRRSAASSA